MAHELRVLADGTVARIQDPNEGNQGLLDDELLAGAVGGGVEGIGIARGAAGATLQELAAQQTGLLEELAAPGRERDRKALEARLLAQGRLGSTPGALDEQARVAGVERARLENQLAGQQLAREERAAKFGMGLELAQFGLGVNAQEIGLGFEAQGLSIQERRLQMEEEARRRAKGPGFGKALLGGLAGAAGAAFGGPIGGMLAQQVVGGLTKEK